MADLLDQVTPEVYLRNPFRILDLPTTATSRDVQRRETRLIARRLIASSRLIARRLIASSRWIARRPVASPRSMPGWRPIR